MAQFARDLEDAREKLFAPLKKYEEIVNEFLSKKSLSVPSVSISVAYTNPMNIDLNGWATIWKCEDENETEFSVESNVFQFQTPEPPI